MGRFVRLEDNEDGTVTMNMNLGEVTDNEEISAVVALSFDELADVFGMLNPSEDFVNFAMNNQGLVTEIPKSIENIDGS